MKNMISRYLPLIILSALLLVWSQSAIADKPAVPFTVALVPDNNPGLGTSHGLKKLQEALEAKGCAYQPSTRPITPRPTS